MTRNLLLQILCADWACWRCAISDVELELLAAGQGIHRCGSLRARRAAGKRTPARRQSRPCVGLKFRPRKLGKILCEMGGRRTSPPCGLIVLATIQPEFCGEFPSPKPITERTASRTPLGLFHC